jgi:hypothetical protein
VPLRGAIVEAYQPVFRKDEETAWTIIQTRKVTKMKSRLSSICSDANTSAATDPGPDNASKSFAFDNELFLGPVYKRLLLAKLCESENKENGSKPAGSTRRSNPGTSGNQCTNDCETRDNDAMETVLEGYATTMWEHRIFSRSCTEDLLEFLERHRPRKLSRRHLPLAVANRQKGLDPEEQEALNRDFLDAVQRRELEQVARALDQGAEANAELDGTTDLQLCISTWYHERAEQPDLPHESTTIAEFLLLYQETRIPYNFAGICNILHFCMHIGGNALLHQVIPSVGGLLEQDIFQRSPLQTAVLCGDISIGCIKALCTIFPDNQLDPYRTVMKTAREASEFARSKGAMDHADQFQKLADGHRVVESLPPRYVIYITNPDPPASDAD